MLGRRDGLRAWVRSQLGLFTWLDRRATGPTTAPPEARAPGATRPSSAAADALDAGWIRVAGADEVAPGEVLEVLADDRPLALANCDGTLYAVDGTCPHAGGPLGDGILEGAVLTCPWHGWSWDVKTGRSLVDDTIRVPTVPVRIVDGAVWVAKA